MRRRAGRVSDRERRLAVAEAEALAAARIALDPRGAVLRTRSRGPVSVLRPPRRRTAQVPPSSHRRSRGWFIAEEPTHRGRGLWLLLAFAAMALAVGYRLIDVQIHQGPQLAAMAAGEHISSLPLHAHRGHIYDSTGRLLASDVPMYAIAADPGSPGLQTPEQRHVAAVALAPVLSIGPGLLEETMGQTLPDGSPRRFVYLAHGVTEQQNARLSTLGLSGIIVLPDDRRSVEVSTVPGQSLAANLIGYVDHDGNGQYGVEGYYNAVLRGQDGSDATVHDLAGHPIVLGGGAHQDAQNGRDLVLGLDSRVQELAQQALAQQVQAQGATSGSVLVMDTQTGSIRAWADYPTYDANQYASADPASIKDLNVDGLYEPGSVMKVVTFAGGLKAKAFTPQEIIDEHTQVVDGVRIQDWDHANHPHSTFQWVLDDSLNNGAIEVMHRTGNAAFYSNLLSFGIGSPTGVDVAGETNQPVAPAATLRAIDYATMSFGQSVQVTPVEMVAAINAVANSGTWVQPHAVDAIVDPATGSTTSVGATTRQVMDPATAATLKTMMTGVVEDRGASGYLVKMPQLKGQIGGKTGTADLATNGRYAGQVIDSFVGFLPLDHPRFTMLVIIRQPQHCSLDGHAVACEGAYLAAPVWKQLSQLMVDTWKITP